MDPFYIEITLKIIIVILAGSFLTVIFIGAPFVPSSNKIVNSILQEIKLKDQMCVYDLGCGDGRFLIEASKKAKIIGEGYELTLVVWLLAKLRVLFSGKKNIHIHLNTYMKADLSRADVVFVYLLPKAIKKLTDKFEKEMKKGSLVISHAFQVAGLETKLITTLQASEKSAKVYIYKM